MKRSWRRTLLWLVSIPAALVGIVASLPWLVDGEYLRPIVITAAARATGHQVAIAGPVYYALLPQPRIDVRGIRLGGAANASETAMAEAERADVVFSWRGLLGGRLVVESLRLHKPRIVLEIGGDSRRNWEFSQNITDRNDEDGGPAIGRIEIVQGSVVHTDHRSGRTIEAEGIDLAAAVGSASAPFRAAGTGTVDGVPLAVDVEIGSLARNGRTLQLGAKFSGGQIDFKGTASALSMDAVLAGKLSLVAVDPSAFIDALVHLSGHEAVQLNSRIAQQLGFEGHVEFSPQRIALEGFKLAIAGETASGTLTLTRGQAPILEGQLMLSRIDGDHWLEIVRGNAFIVQRPDGQLAFHGNRRPPILAAVPELATVRVALNVVEIRYLNHSMRDVSTLLDIREGILRLPEISAILPGNMTLRTRAASKWEDPRATRINQFELAGDQLRETLIWLGIDTRGIPASRLQTLRAAGRVELTKDNIVTSDVRFSLDDAKGTGSGGLTFAIPVVLTATVELPSFDLDSYLPQSGTMATIPEIGRDDPGRQTAPSRAGDGTPDPLPLPKLAVKAKVSRLMIGGESNHDVDIDFVVQGNRLELNRLGVRDLVGATIQARGAVTNYGTSPEFNLSYSSRMSDADRVFEHFALPTFINGRIGTALSTGTITGTLRDITVRDLTVNMLDVAFRATGTVRMGQDFAFNFPRFSMETADPARLLATATGSSFPEIGPVAATGVFRGDTRTAAFAGALRFLGTEMTGQVSTTLDAHPTVTAAVKVSGMLPLERLMPNRMAADSTTFRKAPTNSSGLGFLRSFDGSLTMSADAVTFGTARVAVTELSIGLRKGILNLAKLGGTFHGGTFQLSGGIDASGSLPSVSLSGSLTDIDVANTLGTLRGRNTFGNDNLTIAAAGRLNITAIDISGAGASPEEIARSLTVRGRLAGSVRPSITKGSRSFASFGADIASIFSTKMGLGSAILDGFIDQTSTLDGEVSFANGILSLRNQNILGSGAKAVINSRTDLRQSTTDTTVTFEIGTPGPTDYVLTAKGALVSPTVQVYGSGARR